MTSSQLSTQLRHLVTKISSKINDLELNRYLEIPDREPDSIEDDEIKIWILDDQYSLGIVDHTKILYLNNQPHLIERSNGTREWYKNGQLHREDGPAVEKANGTKFWYRNGQLHREDGPAIEHSNDNFSGTKEWWRNGKRHRIDGPAIEYSDGTEDWYLNGELHRENGPAIIWLDGAEEWYKNGKLHREDGPAIEKNGIAEYWLNGKRIRTKSTDFNSPDFQKRWKKLLEKEHIRQVMED